MALSSAPQININLPSINGEIEAGITVGVDASLPDERKLPILHMGNTPGPYASIKAIALNWAYDQTTDATARRLLMNGIAGIIDLGLIRTVGGVPDGDWKVIRLAQDIPEDRKRLIIDVINIDDMIRSVTIAVATKANFWLMNHHTGQGQVAGYVKKVLDVFYKDRVTEQIVTAAHSLGHYTSTIGVLGIAGIRGGRQTTIVTSSEGSALTLSQDAKLRFASMPAGTHRCGIAYESAKRLVRSVYAQYCPGVDEFVNIPPIRNTIMANPISYHIGASYLTGIPRADYADTDMEQYLGRLGTFINTLYKNSTLAKSPHMAISRVESYEDYNADFKGLLIKIQQVQAQARGRILEERMEVVPTADSDTMAIIKQAFIGQAARAVPPNLPVDQQPEAMEVEHAGPSKRQKTE